MENASKIYPFFKEFCRFFPRFFPLSVPAAALAVTARLPALEGLVDEDDIVPETLDTLPGNIEILPLAKQAEEAARAKDHDAFHAALRDADLHISHIPQPAAVTDIDDLLAPQKRKTIHHSFPPHPQVMHGVICPIPLYVKPKNFCNFIAWLS